MIQFSAWGANLTLAAQGRALLGEGVVTSDGALVSFWTYTSECDMVLKWKVTETLTQEL